MHLKCYWCDTKKQKEDKLNGVDIKENKESYKSINKETDSYIRINNQHYHEDCYREKLSSGKKKYSDQEINDEINKYKVIMDEKLWNDIMRDKFYAWIKYHYQSNLPTYYILRVDSIAEGKDVKKQVYGSIKYEEFLEMYEKLINYLAKQTMNIQFKDTSQRMLYELAIVISQYENYKKFKDNIAKREEMKVDVDKKLQDSNKFSEVSSKVRSQEDDTLYIADIMDELI